MSMQHETFADRLAQAMAAKGLKQADLIRIASKRGTRLGKSQVSQYANGKTEPRRPVGRLLADILEVPEAWLLDGAGHDATGTAKGEIELSEPNESSEIELRSETMREIKKSTKLDNVLYDVRGPVVEEAERMEAAGARVLKLNIGNPAPFDFRAPEEMVFDMSRQLAECEGYSSAKGLFSARKAIMQYAQLKAIPDVDIEDVYTGNGVSELINLSMLALLDNGDEVLVPSPDYPLWTACVTLAGGTPVHYVCDEGAEWYPDMDDIRKKVTSRTKALVIINPNNPTGALYPREVLQELVDIAREHNLIIFSDEIYDRIVMDGLEHVSIASMAPDLFCVTFSGLSKSHMVAGYRIGWMILSGDKASARDYILGLNMLSNMRMCSNVPAQSIVQTALGGHQSVQGYIVPGGRVYEQREYVYQALNDIPGVTAVKPKAGFYIFPKLDVKKFNIVDDEKFALDLLHEKRLLVVHGGGFNWKKPDHFRVVYLPRIEVLGEAMRDLSDFLSHYRQA
ncbi:aminotransferase class I/II-fold pyridoxal phosphate-dependent enzyme [Arabiibacter massiliensis]|uniref:aminotransferase class I/II-fold pyridoxal phosphate-dependent enzyme n=1 Tax=Arabiibacter massiliensis TaxID=1870985 RepID=UPI000B42551D|nr:aminotransferase class I/II-fold pyridoxal phosphate-dependent enzyme [Arabiibacter massiliensis]